MLAYLLFDAQADSEGVGGFEAMASVTEERWPAVKAEIETVLAWCHAWGRDRGAPEPMALDEGGAWDCQLDVMKEHAELLHATFDPAEGVLRCAVEGAARVRYNVTLGVCGGDVFAADFEAYFLRD